MVDTIHRTLWARRVLAKDGSRDRQGPTTSQRVLGAVTANRSGSIPISTTSSMLSSQFIPPDEESSCCLVKKGADDTIDAARMASHKMTQSGSIVSAAMSHLELLDQYLTPDGFDFRVQFMSESGARTAGYAMLRCINRGRRMGVLVSCSTIIVQSAPL